MDKKLVDAINEQIKMSFTQLIFIFPWLLIVSQLIFLDLATG